MHSLTSALVRVGCEVKSDCGTVTTLRSIKDSHTTVTMAYYVQHTLLTDTSWRMRGAMRSGGAPGRALTASSGSDGVYIPLAAIIVLGIVMGFLLMGCIGAVLYFCCVLRRTQNQPITDVHGDEKAASGLTGTSALSVKHMGKSTHLNVRTSTADLKSSV